MPSTYMSIQGDTWDMIAHKVYGQEHAMDALIRANPTLVHVGIFPAGVAVVCPDLVRRASNILPPWRR